MRISTKSLYESGMARMSELQSGLVKTQQQIATGRRILTPSDDPVAAARALEVTQHQEINTQFGLNRQDAKASLSQEEGILQSVTSLLQDAKTLVVSAGNGSLDDQQRKFIATELSGRLDELIGLANTRDGNGNFFFSGYQTSTQPFTATPAGGAQYQGDQGQRMLQVGSTRQLAMSDTGDAVFQQIRAGNGVFTTVPEAGNTGTGIISSGSAPGTGAIGAQYQIVFGGGGTTYSVFDITADPTMAGPPLVQDAAYSSGQGISFNGIQVEISGKPLDNDKFTIAPGTNQSMFKTISDVISVLNAPTSGNGKTTLANGLGAANQNLDNAIDHVLTMRASIGTRLKEIDSLDSAGEERNIQYAQTLADLQDVDYVKAITELTQTQTTLEAAQKSFTKISGLSLFNYL